MKENAEERITIDEMVLSGTLDLRIIRLQEDEQTSVRF